MKYYTAKEVSEILRVSFQTVLKWLREGKMESDKVGNQYRITQEQLDKFTKGV